MSPFTTPSPLVPVPSLCGCVKCENCQDVDTRILLYNKARQSSVCAWTSISGGPGVQPQRDGPELGGRGPAKEAQGGRLGGPDPTPSPLCAWHWVRASCEESRNHLTVYHSGPSLFLGCSDTEPQRPTCFPLLGSPSSSLSAWKPSPPKPCFRGGWYTKKTRGTPSQGKGTRLVRAEPTIMVLRCQPQSRGSAVLAPDPLLR